MGDIGTHAEISRFVIEQANKVLPEDTIPEADFAFLELGNFLTDVSQFRDPPSYHRARKQARDKVALKVGSRTLASLLSPILGTSDWVTAVFGRKSGPQHGALPEMLRLLMSATTHVVFDDDALPQAGSLVARTSRKGPSVLLEHGIPPEDVDHVLDTNYTQYFPHEHLDATPLPGQVASLDRPEFAIGPRHLPAYLEEDLRFLSEQLTWLEASWRRALVRRPNPMSDKERQFALVTLGHLLHAVEDYFFHSNLPEAHAWAAASAEMADDDPSRDELLTAALKGTKGGSTSRELRRVLNRRLRYPVYDAPDELSDTTSQDATDFIYTGGFGPTDVWHTLGGALEALEAQLKLLLPAYDPSKASLVLFRMLLSQKARAAMVANKTLDAESAEHLKQLRDGDYHARINKLKDSGKREGVPVCEHAIAAMLEAFDLDLRVSNKYTGEHVPFPGPGALLIAMMHDMEAAREDSADEKKKLNSRSTSVDGLASDNHCSEENIGTHTLMSKDTKTKDPLRVEAVALAKHASASIAVRFLSSVTRPDPADNEAVDWDAELQFFIRGVVPDGWETELMKLVRQDNFHQPDIRRLKKQPRHGWKPLKAPRTLTATAKLEAYYRSLER
jgi:hypothetical protein